MIYIAEKFNQSKYVQGYIKEHYRTFKVNLKVKEMDILDELLKKKGITKATFLREAIERLKKEAK